MGVLMLDTLLSDTLLGARIIGLEDHRDLDGELILLLDSGQRVYVFTRDRALIVEPEIQ